jgi:hypothetical protein
MKTENSMIVEIIIKNRNYLIRNVIKACLNWILWPEKTTEFDCKFNVKRFTHFLDGWMIDADDDDMDVSVTTLF